MTLLKRLGAVASIKIESLMYWWSIFMRLLGVSMIKFKKTKDGLMTVSTKEANLCVNKNDIHKLYNYLHRCIFTIDEADKEFTLESTVSASVHDCLMKFGCFFPIDIEAFARRHNDQ
ncbi:MAG: hypothetical protein ACUZ8I_06775 [Candidatus Scalindua sp.]